MRNYVVWSVLVLVACSEAAGPAEQESVDRAAITGNVIGVIDGVFGMPGSPYLQGWACEVNQPNPIALHLYLGGPAGSGTFYSQYVANAASEQAINDACHTTGSHRFYIPISPDLLAHAYQSIWIHGISPDGGANNLATGAGAFRVPALPFVKHGDNGAATCNQYCAGAQWGQVGSCMGVALDNFPCTQGMGLLANGDAEQVCTCNAGGSNFDKPGDNGTATCRDFCAGPQWGPVGSCVGARLKTDASALIGGVAVPYSADCSIAPGSISNGAEQTCLCWPVGARPAAGKSTIASGGTNSIAALGMHDLAVASNTAAYRAAGGKLYIHEVGWLNTSEADKRAIAQLFPDPPIFETGGAQAVWTFSEILPYWPGGASVVCVDTSGWPLPGAMPASYAAQIKQAWGQYAGAIGVYYSPNDGKTFNTPWGDPSFEPLRHSILTAGALCTDAPPQFYLSQPEAYRVWTAASIAWARSAGATVVSALYPMQSANEWTDTQTTVNDLLRRGAIPTTWAINGYYGIPSGQPVPHPLGSETNPQDSTYTALQLLRSNGAAP